MEKQLKNPWLEMANNTARENFVIKEEQAIISKFNERVKDEYKIHSSIFSAPFMGNVESATVIILMLNPGYDKDEDVDGTNYYKKYENWWMQQIQHILPYPELPLFCLEKEYITNSSYWEEKLQPVIEIAGRKTVAKNIAKIQYFPYHSRKFKALHKSLLKEENINYLPTQEYNFQLVRNAMKRDAMIVIPRSSKYWYAAIPELVFYQNKYFTNSYGNIIFSEKNLSISTFDKLIKKLKG